MNTSEIQAKLTETRLKWGEWTAHNIELSPGLFTMGNWVRGDEVLVHRCVQIAADQLRKPLKELRVLDLGCLEGLYSIEFARQGAQVLGLDVRDANLEKAKAVKEILGLSNVEFVQDDVRNLSADKYGQFDVILCVGLLYHLDQPDIFHVLEKIFECSRGILILDTHISVSRQVSTQYKGKQYEGLYFKEHEVETSLEQRSKMLWASIDNTRSFWFTRPSLYNCLHHLGYSSVYECHNPAESFKWRDRVTLVAVRGQPVSYLSSSAFAQLPEQEWTEERAVLSSSQIQEDMEGMDWMARLRSKVRLRTRIRAVLGMNRVLSRVFRPAEENSIHDE